MICGRLLVYTWICALGLLGCDGNGGQPDAGGEDSGLLDGASDTESDDVDCDLVEELIERRVLIPGTTYLEDIYASSVLWTGAEHLMWYSGWHGADDFPNDKIFPATSMDGLDWNAPATPAFEIDGAVADPSVVWQESAGRYVMVFSYIGDPESWHGLRPENYELDGDENYLHVWTAQSIDGVEWTDIQELIGRDNGLNGTGAWAPCLVPDDGDAFRVYYHNDPNFYLYPEQRYLVLRSTVDFGGQPEVIDTVAVMDDGKLRANVDVTRLAAGYLMLYNEIVVEPERRFRVASMVSDDGLSWIESDPTPWRPAGTDEIDVATPHIFWPPDHSDELWIFVGEGDQLALQSSVVLWRYALCPDI